MASLNSIEKMAHGLGLKVKWSKTGSGNIAYMFSAPVRGKNVYLFSTFGNTEAHCFLMGFAECLRVQKIAVTGKE